MYKSSHNKLYIILVKIIIFMFILPLEIIWEFQDT